MISSADQTFDLKLELIDSGAEKTEKCHCFTSCVTLVETDCLARLGQDYRIRSTGTSPTVTATLNRHDHFIDFKIRVI